MSPIELSWTAKKLGKANNFNMIRNSLAEFQIQLMVVFKLLTIDNHILYCKCSQITALSQVKGPQVSGFIA